MIPLTKPVFNHKEASLAPLLLELRKLFRHVNAVHYNGALPDPIITPPSHGRKRNLLGYCSQAPWWRDRDGTTERFEIGMSAEHLLRDPIEICSTMLHETAHYGNWYNGIKDCAKSGRHNKRFQAEAERLGLAVAEDPKIGWAVTSLTAESKALIDAAQLDMTAFDWGRYDLNVPRVKAETKMKKWTCGCYPIRAAVEINLVCQTCGKPLVKVDTDEGGDEDA